MKTRSSILLVTLAMAFATSPAQAGLVADAYYAPGAPVADEYVIGPTVPGKWGSPVLGTGAVVTYSYMASGIATEDGPSLDLAAFMPAGYKAAIAAAFNAWSSVANITFLEVPDSGLPFNDPGAVIGDIRIGGTNLGGPGGTLAHGYYPPANGSTAAGDIHFDLNDLWKIGFGGPGFDIFQVAAHEIGHALGLNHEVDTDGGGPDTQEVALMNPFYTEAFAGPQADDIEAIQILYGPAVPAAVPEPSSLVLLGLVGLGGVGYRWRRSGRREAA